MAAWPTLTVSRDVFVRRYSKLRSTFPFHEMTVRRNIHFKKGKSVQKKKKISFHATCQTDECMYKEGGGSQCVGVMFEMYGQEAPEIKGE